MGLLPATILQISMFRWHLLCAGGSSFSIYGDTLRKAGQFCYCRLFLIQMCMLASGFGKCKPCNDNTFIRIDAHRAGVIVPAVFLITDYLKMKKTHQNRQCGCTSY